jgi:outer membrane autotransporter protein
MKKEIIIGGVVVAVGAVAYFLYTKQKKKEEGLVVGSQLSSPTTEPIPTVNPQTPPAPTSGVVSPSTTLMSIEEQKKLDQARDLFEELKVYLIKNLLPPMPSAGRKFTALPVNGRYGNQINSLKDRIFQLGYEVKGTTNPILVKLNSL